jgi:epsilon-lactone hydrolase
MASIQGCLVEFILRRLNFFGGERVDPYDLRLRMEQSTRRLKPSSNVQVVPVAADGVPAEWLIPPDAAAERAFVYIHGGAWFMGSPSTHRYLVSRLAQASGVQALSLDYRLAPENPFPAGLEDCLTAYE